MKVARCIGISAVVLLAACGGGGGSSKEGEVSTAISTSTEAPSSTTEVQPEATVATTTSTSTSTTIPKDPQEELDLLAFFNQAIDQSKIVDTECGKFALLVFDDQIKFYKWLNNLWADNSDVLGPDGRWVPKYVKSVDLTGDSVLDLFVQYNDPDTSEPIGAVFLENNCVWDWALIDNGDYTAEFMEGLTWSEQRQLLTGSTVNWDGYEVPFTVTYSDSYEQFEAEFLPFEPPPPACIAAFNRITRKDFPELRYSFYQGILNIGSSGPYFGEWSWDDEYDRGTVLSLRNCRKNDWLTEAKRRRSQYSNHVDAIYFGDDYVLLSNENATAVLKELCTMTVVFRGTSYYVYKWKGAIACDGY